MARIDNTTLFWYWFTNLPHVGKVTQRKLLEQFHSPKEAYENADRDLLKLIGMQAKGMEQFQKEIDFDGMEKKIEQLHEKGIKLITIDSKEYPNSLRHIYDPPYVLYIKGSLPRADRKSVAIVGARSCSEYGRSMAIYFAKELARAGVQIISGLARGVDSYAHRGAIEQEGSTYAVLGSGIDVCYPIENFNLYQELSISGGVISEYNLGYAPIPANFPMRNRIISGLSDGILLVEARKKSGSLITVDYGLEHGKDIYALPGRIMDSLSYGTNHVIQEGGKLVMNPSEILHDLGIQKDINDIIYKKNNSMLETIEKIVYAKLSYLPKHMENIMKETNIGIEELSQILLSLQIKGYIKQTAGNYYSICKGD